MKTLATVLAAVAAATVAVPAAASTSLHVAVGDLDLTTAAGQSAMAKRIDRAAWKVCLFNEAGTLRSPEAQTACTRAVTQDAATQIAAIRPREVLASR